MPKEPAFPYQAHIMTIYGGQGWKRARKRTEAVERAVKILMRDGIIQPAIKSIGDATMTSRRRRRFERREPPTMLD